MAANKPVRAELPEGFEAGETVRPSFRRAERGWDLILCL